MSSSLIPVSGKLRSKRSRATILDPKRNANIIPTPTPTKIFKFDLGPNLKSPKSISGVDSKANMLINANDASKTNESDLNMNNLDRQNIMFIRRIIFPMFIKLLMSRRGQACCRQPYPDPS